MRTWAAVLLFLAALPLPGQEPMDLRRISDPPRIDGVMNDPVWKEIEPLPLTMYVPLFRGQPTQCTEIRVAYDDEAVYVGGWFYDSEPKGIRINSLYRDRWNGDDALAIYIDGYNDDQNAKWFGITPAGVRFDLLVSDDGNTINDNWDAFWNAKTTVTGEGWFVEVRIPFSSIGIQVDQSGHTVMGLTVTRLVSRLEERVTFPAIDPKFPFRRPSQAQDVRLQGLRNATALHVTPYALMGRSRTAVIRADDSHEAGVDLRYRPFGNLTIDLTANTDFAQVEADEQQVALDRFPLFFPERRRFFQEGAGLFDFVTTNGLRLFHSRRIGLTSQFQPVRILGGARVVGRLGTWEIGALNMQTEKTDHGPGENFGVLRLRRPILNASSTAGMILTSYAGGGRRNFAGGADASLRVKGDDYVILKWAASHDRDEAEGTSFVSRSLFDARWERRTGRGLAYNWQLSRAGKDYRPELGFLPRRDFTAANVIGNYFIFTEKSPIFRRVYPGALAFSTFRNSDRSLESGTYAFWLQWDTKAGGGGWIEPKWFREQVRTPFTIGGTAHIPAGTYDFADLQFVYSMPTGSKMRTDLDLRSGTYFDGRRSQLILKPTWNVSRHLELGADYQRTLLRFPSRDEKADIHLARIRIRTALDVRASGNAFVQYNSTTNRLDFNVRLRYALAEGTDLWIVYNEGLDTDPAALPGQREEAGLLARALLVKYSHTFSF